MAQGAQATQAQAPRGTEWDTSHGSGGGGAGRTSQSSSAGGAGGNYGAGGGGSKNNRFAAGGNGTQGVIAITYNTGDPLAATAINDDSTGNSVPCASIVGDVGGVANSNCWTIPDNTKAFGLPSSVINTPGTYTYSAQIKTSRYSTYNGYATVQVKVCPVGQGPDPSNPGQCITVDQCTDIPGYQSLNSIPSGCQTPSPAPGTCIPSGYTYNSATNSCVNTPAVPTLNANSFTATRVRAGSASTLSWSIPNMASGITCAISPTPASGTQSGDITYLWNGSSNTFTGTAATPAITQPTTYTLTCTNQITSASRSVTVNIVPSYQEI